MDVPLFVIILKFPFISILLFFVDSNADLFEMFFIEIFPLDFRVDPSSIFIPPDDVLFIISILFLILVLTFVLLSFLLIVIAASALV
uniref:Uncharacterized protein n=1 Tax=Arsenophonus endosymbiont of Trialeurodes vaporariorum TaxID=235567 RepID=A0A3B0M4I6_9GAMM